MKTKHLLSLMRAKSYRPMTVGELKSALGEEDENSLRQFLNAMEKEGLIVRTRKAKYGLPEKMGLISGKLQASNKGYAFVLPLDRQQEDLYISALNLGGAMNGDVVLARILTAGTGGHRSEGEIIRILQRANEQVVGTFDSSGNLDFVVPDDHRLHQDIIIPLGNSRGAKIKDKVVVEITRWPKARRNPEGRVTEVLGPAGQPGVDVLSIIKKHGLETDFPLEVLGEAEDLPRKLGPQELLDRKDLRGWSVVTIDDEDARDLDDAVSLESLPDGNYLLGVHIADVSYYVLQGSQLDQEALHRCTSVYLVDRVVPMLPPRLANDLCSLNMGEDRLTVTVLMTLTPRGTVKSYDFFPSLIRVREKMSYNIVRRILQEKDPELCLRYRELIPTFRLMAELAAVLNRRRQRRGSIDFDFIESRIELYEQGVPLAIVSRPRSRAENIIEEFMIAANEIVARHFYELAVPAVYRVHEEPALDKLTELNSFLKFFGLHIKPERDGRIKPRAYQKILAAVKGRPEERVISMVMLRSMMHARYDVQSLGHFGLSTSYYCHFTAPIRRYPDLLMHRILRETWSPGGISAKRLAAFDAFAAKNVNHLSERERVAEEAERESQDMKRVQYMERHVGQKFIGIISSVLAFGFFVELENTIEGLVHVSTLTDDYYHYLPEQLALAGEHTGKVYRIGQKVEVLVTKVNTEVRQIDFELLKAEKTTLARQPQLMKSRRGSRSKALKKRSTDKAVARKKSSKARSKKRAKRSKSPKGRR